MLRNKKRRDAILKNPTPKELQYLRNICYQLTKGKINMDEKRKKKEKYTKSPSEFWRIKKENV